MLKPEQHGQSQILGHRFAGIIPAWAPGQSHKDKLESEDLAGIDFNTWGRLWREDSGLLRISSKEYHDIRKNPRQPDIKVNI